MKIEIEQLKSLVENGDKAALESYILSGIEKSDVETVSKTNDEVKRYFDSEKDKHFGTALETWKSNNLTKIIDEEVNKRNPTKSAAEIEVEKLRKEIEDERKGRNREALKNKAFAAATTKKLPTDILDFFIADDEDATNENLNKLEAAFQSAVQSAVDGKFKENGRDVHSGGAGSTTVKSIQDMAAAHNIRNQQGGNN